APPRARLAAGWHGHPLRRGRRGPANGPYFLLGLAERERPGAVPHSLERSAGPLVGPARHRRRPRARLPLRALQGLTEFRRLLERRQRREVGPPLQRFPTAPLD